MYFWLWRHLPGPLAVRIALALALALLAVYLLFEQVFPWVDPRLPWNKVAPTGIGGQ